MTNEENLEFHRVQTDMIACVANIGFLTELLDQCRSDVYDGMNYNWDTIEYFLEDCLKGNEDSLKELDWQWKSMKVLQMKEKELLEVNE